MTALVTAVLCAMVVVAEVWGQQYYYYTPPPPSREQSQGYVYSPYQGPRHSQGDQVWDYPITSYPAPPQGFQAAPPFLPQVYQPYHVRPQGLPYGENGEATLASPWDSSGAGAMVHELIGTGLDVVRGLAQPNVMDAAAVFLRRGQRLVSHLGGRNGGADLLKILDGSGVRSMLIDNPATRLVGDFLKNGLTVDIGRFQEK